MPHAEIALQLSSLHAITSSGRMDVLRCLRARRMTMAEVSTKLSMRKSSAHKHLTSLAKAGFVTRHDDHRRWVYYSLTPQGRHLVENEKPRLVLILAAIIAALIALLGLAAYRLASATRMIGPTWGFHHRDAPTWSLSPPTLGVIALALVLVIASAVLARRVARVAKHAYG